MNCGLVLNQVYIYNLRTDEYVHLQSTKDDPYSLSDNAVYSLYEDREDGIWVPNQ